MLDPIHPAVKFSIASSSIISFYEKLGIDVKRLIPYEQTFQLCPDDNGVLCWTPAIGGDDEFYQALCKIPWYYSKHKKEFEYVARLVQQNSSVLEIGCGNGYFQDYARFASYTGLEFNSAALGVARGKGYKVSATSYQQHAIEMPNKYDLVCSFQVLEHLPDYVSYFKSSFKLLKDDGILVTSVPSQDSIFGLANNVLNAPPHHITRWTDSALTTVAENCGFECVETVHMPIESPHARWFFDILFQNGFPLDRSHQDQGKYFLNFFSSRLRIRILWVILRLLGFSAKASVRSLPINGHTVISICRKRAIGS